MKNLIFDNKNDSHVKCYVLEMLCRAQNNGIEKVAIRMVKAWFRI